VAQERQDAQHQPATRTEPAGALGPPRERADRDCRTQTLRTMRPLRRDNALTSFRAVLVGGLNIQGSLDGLLRGLFARSGARLETAAPVLYWVHTTGVSVAYQRLRAEVVNGFGTMDVRHQGKPSCVRLTALSS
jgi:hypothetical protein